MREDYQFVHTFDMSTAEQRYKVKPGSVVVFLAERFQTKYEPKWHVFEIKVCLSLSPCAAWSIFGCESKPEIHIVLFAAYVDFILSVADDVAVDIVIVCMF